MHKQRPRFVLQSILMLLIYPHVFTIYGNCCLFATFLLDLDSAASRSHRTDYLNETGALEKKEKFEGGGVEVGLAGPWEGGHCC